MPESARAHAAVAGVFFAFGVGVGLWGGAAGSILARAHVDSAAFGALLTAYTVAYLIAMSAAGALAHRFGVRRVLPVSATAFGAALCALLNAGSALLVGGVLIASGLLGGVVDVTMNAEGARIERRLGRPILARLHAAASAGMAIGAILGSLIVASRAPWGAGLIAALGLVAAGLVYGRAAGSEPGRATVALPSVVRGLSFSPALIGLGIVIGVSIAAETAALLWSTLLLRAEAPKLAAIAGSRRGVLFGVPDDVAFQCGCHPAQNSATSGSSSDRSPSLRQGSRSSPPTGGFALSVAGFALIGIGTGAIVPCTFALAARESAAQPAIGLSSASLFSALTRLPAPLATGAIAQSFSLPVAFAAFAVALALAAVGVGAFASGRDAAAATKR